MLKLSKYSGVVILLLICSLEISFCQNDTISSGTISASESIIDDLNTQTQSLSNYFSLSKIIVSILIIILTFLFLRIISFILGIWAERNTKYRVTIKGVIPLIRVMSWIAALTFILAAVFKPPMASILAFSASVGVAIGFASQDLLKNIFGDL